MGIPIFFAEKTLVSTVTQKAIILYTIGFAPLTVYTHAHVNNTYNNIIPSNLSLALNLSDIPPDPLRLKMTSNS